MAALRTISLRLRGTSTKELEEAGEDTTGVVESKSKLRTKIQGYTGVDILTDTGAYKSTYEILLEISKVWDDLTDTDQAGLLEMIAGKTRSNTAAAILSNSKDLEEALLAAQEAEGSALKENEKYLDSIQGKLDQFNNSVQTMWSNTLKDEWIKGVVEFGTTLIKIIDDVGLLKIALMGVGMYLTRNVDFVNWGKSAVDSFEEVRKKLPELKAEMDKAIAEDAQKKTSKSAAKKDEAIKRYNDADEYVKRIEAEDLLNKKAQERIDLQDKLDAATEKYEKGLEVLGSQEQDGTMAIEAFEEMGQLEEQIKKNGMTLDEAKTRTQNLGDALEKTSKKGVGGFTKLKSGVISFGKQVGNVIAQMAAMYAITTALELLGKFGGWAINKLSDSSEELQDKFEELNNELSSAQNEVRRLEDELDTTQKRMEELTAMGTLSFVEQEELNNLRKQSSELERQIGFAKTLEESLQNVTSLAAINASQKMFSDTSFYATDTKEERTSGAGETGQQIGTIAGYAVGTTVMAKGVTALVSKGATALASKGGAALGAKIGTALGSFAPGIGNAIGLAAGTIIGGLVGKWIGSSGAKKDYESEQTVDDVLNNMASERAKLEKTRDEAYKAYTGSDPKNKKAYEASKKQWEEAQSALGNYDAELAKHMSSMQQYLNSIDPKTLTNPADKEYYEQMKQWVNTYSVMMGGAEGKASVIESLFGDEAEGGFAKAREEIKKLKEELKEAYETEDDSAITEALENLKNFKLDFLSDEDVARLREMGIYLYEAEDYFKDVVKLESKFVDAGLEDVVKDINKITDGLEGLKSAFEEIVEKGYLTAKAANSLKDSFGWSEGVPEDMLDYWNSYLETMMSGLATTEQMTQATEEFAKAYLMHQFKTSGLTEENRNFYRVQLRELGVENPDELMDDLLQDYMVEELESKIRVSRQQVANEYFERNGNSVLQANYFNSLTDKEVQDLAMQYGLIGEITDDIKQEVMERYSVEEDAIDGIIKKLNEKAQLEQEIADIETEKGRYNEWRNGDGTNKGFLALQQEVEGFNPNDYVLKTKTKQQPVYDSLGLQQGYKDVVVSQWYEKSDGSKLTTKKFSDLKQLKTEYDTLYEQGKNNGWLDDNDEVVDPGYEQQLSNAREDIDDIIKDIKKNATIDVQLEMGLVDENQLVDDIQNVFDTLKGAVKEFNENGYLTVDTAQSLLNMDDVDMKYLSLLQDENGQLKLNEQSIYDVAKARMMDLGVKRAITVIDNIRNALDGDNIEKVKELTNVTYGLTEKNWDLVDSEMAKVSIQMKNKGMSNAEITSFENQIKAIKNLTNNAIANFPNSLSSAGNTAKEEAEDAFKKAMDYWENRIGANQSLYEQIQNDIDLLEKKGQIAGESYYQAQINVEKEHLAHLKAQRAEAAKFLEAETPGTERWWEIANTLNDIENEIDGVTLSIQDLSDAMDQVKWTIFDEAHERMEDLTSQLSNVREILSADEDSFFTDEGEWAENGIAVVATYVQEIELAKNKLADVNKELGNLSMGDFDSEQEYYDKVTELTNLQQDYTMAISDSGQAVVDMYESQIDAVEEYTEKLIDSYNDYIDSVKSALDAERD